MLKRQVYKAQEQLPGGKMEYVALKKIRMDKETEGVRVIPDSPTEYQVSNHCHTRD